ncbi:hypothetical protein K1T71_006698 [Dendrolimus kikuchii]|uniref:Uncharacterized protein n=1 Tax=Dendrolimus kikuchii TaxID=765133 RepID=A0ACC1D1R9_9NEOP|nr:hypothetical protein K1T71_006698 [Dendrolimus kikuchii]
MPPVPVRPSVSVLLSTLQKNCSIPFLSTQINSKVNECLGAQDNEIQRIKCLIFYDINSQLCAAANTSKLALKDDYSAQLNVVQDVNTLCNEAKDWVFSNISGYSNYKAGVENVFKRQGTCGQVCGKNDLSGNANEYCKYYKWGTEMLRSQVISTTTTTQASSVVAEVISGKKPVEMASNSDQKGVTTLNKDLVDLKIKHDSSSPELKHKETSSKSTLNEKNESISSAQAPPNVTGVSLPANKLVTVAGGVSKIETNSNISKQEKPPLDSGDGNVNQIEINKSQSGHDYVQYVPPNSEKDKDPVLDVPNTKDQGDTGLGSDGLDDTHYDNVDDTEDGADIKTEEDKKQDLVAPAPITGNKLPVDEIESFGPVKGGYYASTNQDGYSDDDDHFFTFFLITVIMVVLFYVLYHNKNKVSKVFFGLMVEGRQAGRRRNSRGHAYRRLDTLEQAMSGNASAPPSKIIY